MTFDCIMQAALLRAMAPEYKSTDPDKTREMRLNADWFEDRAIEVQLEAKEDTGADASEYLMIGAFERCHIIPLLQQ